MRISVVHAVPRTSSAFSLAEDGFTAAMHLVARHHEVQWLNVHPQNPDAKANSARIHEADFVLARSDWGWIPSKAVDRALYKRPSIPAGLLIAGSSPAPHPQAQLRFDVLFYETSWYAPFVAEHPRSIEAFGIDLSVMNDRAMEVREWDWLMVGRLAAFKRPETLLGKTGRRIAIGDLASADPELLRRMRADGIEVRDQTTHQELAYLYNSSKRVLVPCTLQGGGERAVWEARACGCQVEIAHDNPKLATLLTGPIPSHEDYAQLLLDGIEAAYANPIDSSAKLAAQRIARWELLSDKARRSPSTLRLRSRGVLHNSSAINSIRRAVRF